MFAEKVKLDIDLVSGFYKKVNNTKILTVKKEKKYGWELLSCSEQQKALI